MYNISQITSGLENLVGFDNETGFSLDSSLTSPSSSLTINGFDSMLSLVTLNAIKPENLSLDEFLISQRKKSTQKVIADLISHKLSVEAQKSVLEETPLINGTASLSNTITKDGRFVGWLFKVPESINLRHTILQLMVQFTENVIDLPIYVYHSSQQEPVQTIQVSTSNAPSVSTITLDEPIVLQFKTDQTDAGGYYLIGYYENDLGTAQALNKKLTVGVRPCGTCDTWSTKYFAKWSPYLKTQAVYAPAYSLDSTNLPSRLESKTETNFGLNFYVSIGCDLTDFIVSHKELFASTIQARLALDLLKFVETSPTRNNYITDSLRKEAFIRINGSVSENNHIKVKGLVHVYSDYLKGINFDFSRLDKFCLASTRSGVRWNR